MNIPSIGATYILRPEYHLAADTLSITSARGHLCQVVAVVLDSGHSDEPVVVYHWTDDYEADTLDTFHKAWMYCG